MDNSSRYIHGELPLESPEYWTPQLLTEEELGKICQRLMRWQNAATTTSAVCEEKVDTPWYYSDIQDLIRHIGALRAQKE